MRRSTGVGVGIGAGYPEFHGVPRKGAVRKGGLVTRIIGIDPGIARAGYGVIDVIGNRLQPVSFGCIETPSDWSTGARLHAIHREVSDIVEKFKPEVMAVEELFFNRNTTTAFTVGQARGVILLAGVEHGVETAEYTPMQVKLAVVGYGKADKKQVQEMVRVLLHLSERPKPDDTADALAVAITHAHTAPLRQALIRTAGASNASRQGPALRPSVPVERKDKR